MSKLIIMKADCAARYKSLLERRTGGDPVAMAAEDARLSAMAIQPRYSRFLTEEEVRAAAARGKNGNAKEWKKPTPAQAEAGNYYKPRMQWHGLEVAIENPAGTVREGVDETGKAWRTEFKYAYGEIVGTEGVDGDPVDVFVGPYGDAKEVYIVRQMKRKQWDVYDEDKCMIDFPSMEAARDAYCGHYDDPRFYGGIIAMPVDEFIKKVKATKNKPDMIKSVVLFIKKS